jgi:hypothetical protein
MADKMHNWITSGERPLPSFLSSMAKPVAGGSSKKAEDDDDSEDDEDDEDDNEDDDDLSEMSDDELRAALKEARTSLSRAGGSVKKKRDRIKSLNRELEEARKPKPSKKPKDDDDDDGPDLETIRHEAKAEGEKAGTMRAKRAEAKASLLGAGVNSARVNRAVGLLDLDELDLDDDGLDGIDDAIEDLRKEWPELFAKQRKKRESVAGDNDRDGSGGERRGAARNTKSASQKAADKLLGRSRD